MDIRPWIILFCVVKVEPDVFYSNYTRKPVFDNKLPMSGQLWSVYSRSIMECCVICQTDGKCLSFFYKLQQCKGFPYRMTPYVTTNDAPDLVYADMNVMDALFVALLRGGWRNKMWLIKSNYPDRRNTLIVELDHHCGNSFHDIRAQPDYGYYKSLTGMAATYICLRDNNVEPDVIINDMTYSEQRQRLITFLGGSTSLNNLGDHDLASHCH